MRNIVVNSSDKKEYVYRRTEPVGRRFDPEFTPDLTPKQMLELGILGGMFFPVKTGEFPKHWSTRAKISDAIYRTDLNFFQVKPKVYRVVNAPEKRGSPDPLGWFQWYCRYYMGRRIPDVDKRQIERWKAVGSYRDTIRQTCAPKDMACSRAVRQLLLEWAYDSRNI